MRRLVVGAVLPLVLAGCVGEVSRSTSTGGETALTEASQPETSTTIASTTSTPAPTTTTTTAPTTTTTEAPQGSLDRPLPVGAGTGFSYSDFSTDWEGTILGMVETGLGRFNSENGQCLVLVGTLTPTAISDGAVTSGFSTPRVSLIAAGGLIDSEVNDCDTESIEAAGYGWILDTEVTAGTTFPFYTEFFFPGDTIPEIEAIVVGSASSDQALYYEPTILESTPTP